MEDERFFRVGFRQENSKIELKKAFNHSNTVSMVSAKADVFLSLNVTGHSMRKLMNRDFTTLIFSTLKNR